MEMEMQEYVGLAGAPVVIGLVEVAKRLAPDLDSRFWPPLALAFGVALNLALMPWSGAIPLQAAIVGVVVGLVSSGLYSNAKAIAG